MEECSYVHLNGLFILQEKIARLKALNKPDYLSHTNPIIKLLWILTQTQLTIFHEQMLGYHGHSNEFISLTQVSHYIRIQLGIPVLYNSGMIDLPCWIICQWKTKKQNIAINYFPFKVTFSNNFQEIIL